MNCPPREGRWRSAWTATARYAWPGRGRSPGPKLARHDVGGTASIRWVGILERLELRLVRRQHRPVGLADVGTLPMPRALGIALGSAMLLPALWAMHSVKKYFGFARALGGDHFFERYRTMPMVREGAFKYSSNAMYTFVFIGFWGIALLCRSRAALAVAMFQHAYIWVHWYCTEQPDGVVLYGRSPDED